MRPIDADALIADLEHDVAIDEDMLDYEEMTEDRREIIQFDKDYKQNIIDLLNHAPTIEPTANSDKYEYHYDHTDCIWYRPEARNRCPSTCAQYRDGWNDAMNYIFRDGKGYRPYRRDKQYEERKEGADGCG